MKTIKREDITASGIADFPAALSGYSEEKKIWLAHQNQVELDNNLPEPVEPLWVDFGGDTEKYTTALEAYQTEKASRFQPYPAPIIPDIVAELIANDGSILDYEIQEPEVEKPYVPTPEEKLQARRNELSAKVEQTQIEEANKLVSPGKRRLVQLRLDDIREEDQKRVLDLGNRLNNKSAELSSVVKEIQSLDQKVLDMKDLPEDERKLSPADQLERNKAAARVAVLQEELRELGAQLNNQEEFNKAHRDPEDQKFLDDQVVIQAKLKKIDRWGAQATSDIEDLTVDDFAGYALPPVQL